MSARAARTMKQPRRPLLSHKPNVGSRIRSVTERALRKQMRRMSLIHVFQDIVFVPLGQRVRVSVPDGRRTATDSASATIKKATTSDDAAAETNGSGMPVTGIMPRFIPAFTRR